jgi:hypothetical protein
MEILVFGVQKIDHRAIFLDMVEGRIRANAIAAAYSRGSGLLMRLDHSTRVQDVLESEVAAHLQSVKDFAFGRYGLTPEHFALESAGRSEAAWWVVTYPMQRAATDVRGGDVYMSVEQVEMAVEDFTDEGYDVRGMS